MRKTKILDTLVCCLGLISTAFALSCQGSVDIVIAAPGSFEQVPRHEFDLLENFFIDMVNYYNVSRAYTNIGLILYGRNPKIITPLNPLLDKRDINTRITLMAQRELYTSVHGGQNVVKAMDAIIELHRTSKRPHAPKVGVIVTYGEEDLSSPDSAEVAILIRDAGERARAAGITMFAVSAGGTVPGFEYLGMDRCRLFSLGNFEGLPTLLPYIASGICYVYDPSVNPIPTKCFPVVLPRRPQHTMTCPPPTSGFFPDRNNGAYFIQCTQTGRIRTRCAGGTLFDEHIKTCIHKVFVKCPKPTGLFRHPHNCGKYLNCFANIPYVQSCPAGLYFNPNRNYCDFKINVPCPPPNPKPAPKAGPIS